MGHLAGGGFSSQFRPETSLKTGGLAPSSCWTTNLGTRGQDDSAVNISTQIAAAVSNGTHF